MTISPKKFGLEFFGYLMSARYLLAVLVVVFVVLWLFLWLAESSAHHGVSQMGYGPWQSLYLAAATALTVGYGDLAPVTVSGRIISIVLGFEGLIFMGVVIAAAVAALPSSEI
jgi:voltage-gated potassium channel